MSDLVTWQELHPVIPRKPVSEMTEKEAEPQQDPEIAGLLAERARSRDDEHRKAIDFELKQRGYTVDESPAEKRSAAVAGDKTAPPEGRTPTRGKQSA